MVSLFIQKLKELTKIKLNKLNTSGTASLVCKLELFKDWIAVYKSIKSNSVTSSKLDGINFTENDSSNLNSNFNFNYNHVKLLSKEYQLAKLKVYEAFRKANLGQWITKPWEQNYFSLSADSATHF
jgi:Mor family transcriptional regulator